MDLVVQTVVNAWMTTAIYILIAVGISIVFGVMKIANFAHGEFYMIGAYVVWVFYAKGGIPFAVAIVIAIAIGAGLGLVAERGIFRPLRGEVVKGLVASAGLLFILQVTVGQIWGVGLPKPVPPAYLGTFEFFGATLGWQRLIAIPVAWSMVGGLWFFLSRFKVGQALRATAQDAEVAALQGININRMGALAMGIGCAFAAVAGALMAPVLPVGPYMGHALILMAFVIVILGGVGNILGSIIASIILGFVVTFVTTYLDAVIASIIAVLCMLVVLATKPTGLMGRVKV